MADKELRLRVGASIDASVATVFRSVVDAAKRAQTQVAQATVQGNRQRVAAQKTSAKEVEKVFMTEAQAAKKLADSMVKDVAKSARDRVKLEKDAMREVERDLVRHNRERARMAKENEKIFRSAEGGGARRPGGGGARPPGYGQVGGVWYNRNPMKNDALLLRGASAAAHAGRRFVGDAMHGMGVDTSIQGQLSGAVHREKLAAQISTGAYIPGHGDYQGPEGSKKQIDPKEIEKQAMQVANETGNTTENILEGVDKFVQATGDFKTIQDSMKEIGVIAKANGSDFEEMAMVAKDISVSMGDVKDKGPAIAAVMKTIAGQGHMGSVTMREQGKNMALLTAQANFFKIDPKWAATLSSVGVNQETTQRVAVMGAMQQYARALGGRTSGRQASQSAMAFMQDMASGTEQKRLAAVGITPFNADNTKRDPIQIMLEAFKVASHGGTAKGNLDQSVITKLFSNSRGRAFALAMAQGYDKAHADSKAATETERHAEAQRALVKGFEQYLTVTQGADEIMTKFNTHMATADSQANIMNNRFGEAADALKTALIPALPIAAAAIVGMTKAAVSFLDMINGTKGGVNVATASADAGIRGVNARSILRDAERTGNLTSPDNAEVEETVKVLEKAIVDRKAQMSPGNAGPLGSSKSFGEMSDEALSDSGPRGKKFLEDKTAIAQMKATLDDIKQDRTIVNQRYLEGSIKIRDVVEVRIVEDKTVKPGGGATPHTDGTTGGDSGELNGQTSH